MHKALVSAFIAASISIMTVSMAPWAIAAAGDYGKGDPKHPITNSTWPAGLANVANRVDRIGGHWVNSSDTFYFAGDTRDFNDFLKQYAKVQSKPLQLIIDNYAGQPRLYQPTDPGTDWQLSSSGWPAASASVIVPRHGRINLKSVQVPTNVAMQLAGVNDTEISMMIAEHTYVAAHPADAGDKVDPRITAFVDYMANKGVALGHGPGVKDRGKWTLHDSKADGYTFTLYIRAFSATETEVQMDADSKRIQMACRLNHAAHLGLSLSISARSGVKPPLNWDELPTLHKLEHLFDTYGPPSR